MRNLKLVLAFDGTAYAGWQRQPDCPTIQGTVEEKIAVMTGAAVILNGAGRTDAGVHALGMVANFRTEAAIPCAGFRKGLNSMLPDDIRVLEVTEVESDFHACHSAVAKTYFYNLILGRELMPMERLYNCRFPGHFALDTMRACLQSI
ncbi:MAG: tRNA pseudouridine(38-40) synthase TruA, partial [Desulfobulbaceae bacterium]|nr:tRNA pseudouridine(38-40) synthase TruA [Desulfobulbaceae bacterium]